MSMHATGRSDDHIDKLSQIIGLAIAGVASSETLLNLAHAESGKRAVFETIHRLAMDASEIAEEARAKAARNGELPVTPATGPRLRAAP